MREWSRQGIVFYADRAELTATTNRKEAESMVMIHLKDIVREFKQVVGAKYPVSDMRLFGSNARGDATGESDIDIFLQIADLTTAIEQDVYNMAYELELKYDCVIDVILLSDATVRNHADYLPIYRNILREGVRL
ncbi:MAG: nucleotidyltransferase domain-containing protein [Candidatus Electrothrix sp. MAN1_4]|nr:nucleotidyltransferase domain-containing protein [Candidatus Electrothrix sp. MAN1_4]